MTARFIAAVGMAIALWAANSRANLGETAIEVESHYGAAHAKPGTGADDIATRYYVSGGMGIAVKFMNGKSQSETYMKVDHSDFSQAEMALLLEANRLRSDWISMYRAPGTEHWQLKSKAAAAFYYGNRHVLVISTKEFIRSGNKIKLIDKAVNSE